MIISYNEESKEFTYKDCLPILIRIAFEKPSFVVICTQESGSHSNNYQNILGIYIQEYNYKICFEKDAAKIGIYDKNVKTRIYTNNNTVHNDNKLYYKFFIESLEYKLSKESGLGTIEDRTLYKGSIFTKLNIKKNSKEYKIIVINSHLYFKGKINTGLQKRLDEFMQLVDEFELIKQWKDGYSIFFCGDLNFRLNYRENLSKIVNEDYIKDIIKTYVLDNSPYKVNSTSVLKNKNELYSHVKNYVDKLKVEKRNEFSGKTYFNIKDLYPKMFFYLIHKSIENIGIHLTAKYYQYKYLENVAFYTKKKINSYRNIFEIDKSNGIKRIPSSTDKIIPILSYDNINEELNINRMSINRKPKQPPTIKVSPYNFNVHLYPDNSDHKMISLFFELIDDENNILNEILGFKKIYNEMNNSKIDYTGVNINNVDEIDGYNGYFNANNYIWYNIISPSLLKDEIIKSFGLQIDHINPKIIYSLKEFYNYNLSKVLDINKVNKQFARDASGYFEIIFNKSETIKYNNNTQYLTEIDKLFKDKEIDYLTQLKFKLLLQQQVFYDTQQCLVKLFDTYFSKINLLYKIIFNIEGFKNLENILHLQENEKKYIFNINTVNYLYNINYLMYFYIDIDSNKLILFKFKIKFEVNLKYNSFEIKVKTEFTNDICKLIYNIIKFFIDKKIYDVIKYEDDELNSLKMIIYMLNNTYDEIIEIKILKILDNVEDNIKSKLKCIKQIYFLYYTTIEKYEEYILILWEILLDNERYSPESFKVFLPKFIKYFFSIKNIINKYFRVDTRLRNMIKNIIKKLGIIEIISSENPIEIEILNIMKQLELKIKIMNDVINNKDILPIPKNIKNETRSDFLIVSYNEESKVFEENDCLSLAVRICLENPSFVVICTQESVVSKTSKDYLTNYQHIISNYIEELNYTRLLKIDGFKGSKLISKNVRTRIYVNNSTVNFRLNINKLPNKINNILRNNINEYNGESKANIEYKSELYLNTVNIKQPNVFKNEEFEQNVNVLKSKIEKNKFEKALKKQNEGKEELRSKLVQEEKKEVRSKLVQEEKKEVSSKLLQELTNQNEKYKKLNLSNKLFNDENFDNELSQNYSKYRPINNKITLHNQSSKYIVSSIGYKVSNIFSSYLTLGSTLGATFLRLKIKKNDIEYKFIIVNTQLLYPKSTLEEKFDKFKELVTEFRLIDFWKKNYNIFFCGDLNFNLDYNNLKGPETTINQLISIPVTSYLFNNSFYKNDSTLQLLNKNELYKSIEKYNNKNTNTLNFYKNIMTNMILIGIHLTAKYRTDQYQKDKEFYEKQNIGKFLNIFDNSMIPSAIDKILFVLSQEKSNINLDRCNFNVHLHPDKSSHKMISLSFELKDNIRKIETIEI